MILTRYILAAGFALCPLGFSPASAADFNEIGYHSCAELTRSVGTLGYPDVMTAITDRVQQNQAATSRLGNTCNIADYVLVECRLRPSRSIGETVERLMIKAVRNEPLPRIPVCGA